MVRDVLAHGPLEPCADAIPHALAVPGRATTAPATPPSFTTVVLGHINYA